MTQRYAGYQQLKFDHPLPHVLRITMSNPARRNAMGEVLHAEAGRVWREVDDDPDVSAVIVTGEGDAFSTGGDRTMIEKMTADFQVRARVWKEAKDLVQNMVGCSKPIVSAIRGPAFGAGLACALLADIPIAARDARLMDGHTRLGVAAGDHAVLLWPLLCGLARAKYYLLLCEEITGERAAEIGLVSLAVDEAELDAKALEIAGRLAQGAPSAIRWTKHALNGWLRQAMPAFEASLALEFMGFTSPEVAEGLQAMKEKRAAVFDQASPL